MPTDGPAPSGAGGAPPRRVCSCSPRSPALGPSLARAEPLASHGTCPATTFPPGHLYQLAFTGSLTGHLSLTDSPVGPITFPPISGTFCGLLQLPSETAVVQPANLGFAPFDAAFARAMVPAVITAMAPSVGTVAHTLAPDDGLNVQLVAPIGARTGLLGVSCQLPVDLRLSTEGAGGQALTGPLRDASATLVSTGFTIGGAQSTGSGGTCPDYLARQVDGLLALPNSHTFTSVHVTLDISLQQ